MQIVGGDLGGLVADLLPVDSHRDSLHEQLSHLPQHHHGSHQKEDAGYEGPQDLELLVYDD